jgi:hypothetical protein
MLPENSCVYYQATVRRHDCWFFVAALRSFEHMAFDRTCDVSINRFEFFVPSGMVPLFLEFMAYCQGEGLVTDLQQLSPQGC